MVVARDALEARVAHRNDIATMLLAYGARAESVARRARRARGVMGFLLSDEPQPSAFDRLARTARQLRSLEPDKLSWVNLHPITLVPQEMPEVSDYEDYLDRFVRDFEPRLLSYDNYGAMRESNDDREHGKDFEESYFYRNMELLRSRAVAAGVPFWGFALATPHWTYRTPTEPDLRLQVYALLAHGARGIWYFTYRHFPLNRLPADYGATDINNGLLDREGHPTPRFRIAKAINREIAQLGPTLAQLSSRGVHHLSPDQTVSVGSGTTVRAGADGTLLVGTFVDAQQSRYVLLVNKQRFARRTVERIELGEERFRARLASSAPLGQSFRAARPFNAVSVLLSAYDTIRTGAELRLRRGGPTGELVARWEYENLFRESAVLMRFAEQPAGRYYLELARPSRKVGWWSSKGRPSRKGARAYVDGKLARGVNRNLIVYSMNPAAPRSARIELGPEVTGVAEIDKTNGRRRPLEVSGGRVTVRLAAGDGRLLRLSTRGERR